MTAPPARGHKFPLRLDQLKPADRRAPPDAPRAGPPPAAAKPTRPASSRNGSVERPARVVAASAGVGMDSADVRRNMVDRLRAAGLTSNVVLAAMQRIERHRFVDAALVTQAYEDTSLPIGHGQTISKPSVVARMIELLMDGANARATGGLGRVLEIGTGCGYQAAVLASLGRSVISVERLKPLHDKARELLAPMRPPNLRLVYGDGMLGHPPNGPYDSIVSAAGGDALPQAWLDQLAIGGRLVSPVRQAGSDRQVLVVVDRTDAGHVHNVNETVKFVPLKSGLTG
jgi:protein-L-isoaspartate(D-aspartate) O-methyltransferase